MTQIPYLPSNWRDTQVTTLIKESFKDIPTDQLEGIVATAGEALSEKLGDINLYRLYKAELKRRRRRERN